MRVLFNTAEGIRKGFAVRFYSCGHRFWVRCLDGSTYIVDLADLIGTRELRLKS
jgi:hypothetical protein